MDEGAERCDRGDLRAHPGARDDARAHPRDRVEGVRRDAERRARGRRALRVPQAGPAGQPVQARLARDGGRAGPPDRRSGGAREGDRQAARRHGFRGFSGRQARRLLDAGRRRRDRHAPRRRPAERQAPDRADRPDPLRERRVARRRLRLLLLAVARRLREVSRGRTLRRPRAALPLARRRAGRPQRVQRAAGRGPRPAALRQWLPVPDRRDPARRQPGVLRRRSLPGTLSRRSRRRHEGDRDLDEGRRCRRQGGRDRHCGRLRLPAHVEARSPLRDRPHAPLVARSGQGRGRRAGVRERDRLDARGPRSRAPTWCWRRATV